MEKYITIGQFNKNYLFIIGSISVRFIITFISGFTPYLTPNESFYLLGFKSNFFSHPFITNCFQYLSIGLGGYIFELIFNEKNKNSEQETVYDNRITRRSKLIYYNIDKKNYKIYLKKVFLVYFIYYFAKVSMNSLDNLGFNRVKFWPLEFIFLYFFSKKILGKNVYKHQFVSLSIIIIFCTSIYFINSFIPKTNKDCQLLEGEQRNECLILSVNIYHEIIDKIGWCFVPIIILIYFLAMVSNAYSSIRNKWFMDFKYISIYKILLYLGIIGFSFSIILLAISTFIPCHNSNFIKYVCQIPYEGSTYYDTLKSLKYININKQFFLDIFFITPLFLLSSFLNAFFELLIIKNLDPFYLIPIDCAYFLIYEIIDYCITYPKTNSFRNAKFLIQVISNSVSVFICCIYLEIFELHFCGLDKYTRKSILEREEKERKSIVELINPIDSGNDMSLSKTFNESNDETIDESNIETNYTL